MHVQASRIRNLPARSMEVRASDYITRMFPPHPTLDQPSERDLVKWSAKNVLKLSQVWREAIKSAEIDPLNCGDHPEHWHEALEELEREDTFDQTIFGGNRSGKTSYSSWVVVRSLLENPGSVIFCWSQSEKTSCLVQQPRIYQMLPPDMRVTRDDDVASVRYKITSGFVGNTFSLPNGSSCHFWTYGQFQNNSDLIEGMEIGWKGAYGEKAPFMGVKSEDGKGGGGLGNYFDEYLISPTLRNTMEERLSTLNAKNLTSFTPIKHFNETVEEILDGVETIREERTLDDDPPQIRGMTVPRVQRKPGRSVVYFATHKNKFHNYSRTRANQVGKKRDWVLLKLFGVPTRVISGKFPSFDKEKHVVSKLPKFFYIDNAERTDYTPTRYQICVPAGDRPWCIIWVAVDHKGDHYVYQEWPRFDVEGAYAERRDGDWSWGDAAKGECCGMGCSDYKNLAEDMETGSTIEDRIIANGFDEVGRDMEDLEFYMTETYSMSEQEGFQKIHSLLGKDGPSLYVLEHCGNVIGAITGYDVDKGRTNNAHPWKGFVDALRIMAGEGLRFSDGASGGNRTGGY